jgi:hypothetical protein
MILAMNRWWTPYLLILPVLFGVLVAFYKRREAYSYKFKLAFKMFAAYISVILIAVKLGQKEFAPILWGFLAMFAVYIATPGRSRHIPTRVRRKKIADYELRTGKKYNSHTVELDHNIPFSRGGSHTGDNLRVVEKRKNRSKGAKSPWWDLFG